MSPILVRYNKKEQCLDALVLEQENAIWSPLMCSPTLTTLLYEFMRNDLTVTVKVTMEQPKRYLLELA